jgi:hypothetical protein
VREVKDPATGEVLDKITEKTGVLTITNVRDRIATGNYVGTPAKVNFAAYKRVAAQ